MANGSLTPTTRSLRAEIACAGSTRRQFEQHSDFCDVPAWNRSPSAENPRAQPHILKTARSDDTVQTIFSKGQQQATP
jgi:hypothetical protein